MTTKVKAADDKVQPWHVLAVISYIRIWGSPTFLCADEKNEISARKKALENLKEKSKNMELDT